MDNIKKLYKNRSYLDKQGINIILTVLILIAFVLYFFYYQIMQDIKPILEDWDNQKCKPNIIPFAGLINTPPGGDPLKYTQENFSLCLNNILASIVHYFIQPIYYSSELVMDLFNNLMNSVNIFRTVASKFRNSIAHVWTHVLNTINFVIIPMQKMAIKLKDTMSKVQASLVTTLYVTIGAYMGLKSFLGSFIQILILGLIAGAAAILLMWILPFTWPVAATSTALYVVVATFATIISLWLKNILDITSRSIPPKPTRPMCFGKDTILKTKEGYVKMSNLKPGDTLINGSKVTAVFKLLTNDVKIFNLHDTIVTESHLVYNEDIGWVQVKDHPDSIEIKYTHPYVYCINTSNKRIDINGDEYMDWDEIESVDMFKLKNLNILPFEGDSSDIHRYLDAGFEGGQILEMMDGNSIRLKDIQLNDQLANGERVIGIVKIDAKEIKTLKKFLFKNNIELISTDNIHVVDTYLAEYNKIIDEMECDNSGIDYLYNIVTDTGYYCLNGIQIGDYNTAIENIIDLRNKICEHFN